jgi:hypothetical protein
MYETMQRDSTKRGGMNLKLMPFFLLHECFTEQEEGNQRVGTAE